MLTRTILVLANSIRHAPARCIAGREILANGSTYRIGPWIRPISPNGEGELSARETRMFAGYQPRVGEMIEVPLARWCRDPAQPENWTIAPSIRWKRARRQRRKPTLEELAEVPRDLWLQPGEQTDRVSAPFLRRHRPRQSLRFIRVDRVRIRFEWSRWGHSQKRRRAIFRYRGVPYDLALTDPVFEELYRAKFPPAGRPPVEFDVAGPAGCFLCVSLARAYHGVHYKVAATILAAENHR